MEVYKEGKMIRLTPAMAKVLENASEQQDGCVLIKNFNLRWALLQRKLVQNTSGYGYKFGEIQEITEEGRKVLKEYWEQKKGENSVFNV